MNQPDEFPEVSRAFKYYITGIRTQFAQGRRHMEHELCQCGHDSRVHNIHDQFCIACDCPSFTLARRYRDNKKLRVRTWLRRLVRKMRMDQ